ncbi:LEA type 2 family protein [Pseudomonas sp. GV071]|uniref:LEA type 2 family protein n=1 Tax=Pseudomonas sp. GV071 TaxID=2135754 RepID=UPI000D372791|nr:LEA type 2 family protein [Pseudomonas sp. GV071]
MRLATLLRLTGSVLLLLSLSACSLFDTRDDVYVDLVGLEPLPSQDMEARFAVKLRVQNPNESAIRYNGIALELRVNNRPLATGVSDESGEVPRYGERVISVPITISAFSVLRQAWGVAASAPSSHASVPYELNGKLGGGLWGAARFTDTGELTLPAQ